MTNKAYADPALAAVHEAITAAYKAGGIDKVTMRSFDESCLTQVKAPEPAQIKSIRKAAGVSQAVFASYLNVTKKTISSWERGESQPKGTATRLLNVVEKHGIDMLIA